MKKVAISDLSDSAQRRAEKMDEDRDVYARRSGRGWELTQIFWIDPQGAEYEKQRATLLSEGWGVVDFTQ